VARTYSGALSESEIVTVTQTIDNAFSGYVHGAAVHTLDAYDGRNFCVPMERGDGPIEDVRDQLPYYAFRTMGAIGTAAKALGDDELFAILYNLGKELFEDEGEVRLQV
jgi:hypothetical protein